MRLAATTILVLLVFLSSPQPYAAQEVIFITRHAEQVQGPDDPPLSEAGQRRAQGLAELLRDAGITAIYVSELQRTRLTAEPLSRMLQVPVRVHPGRETEALIRRLREQHPRDRVLIVGHSNTVPLLLQALGHPETVTINQGEYDNLFLVLPRGEDPPVVVRERLSPSSESRAPGKHE